MPPCQHISRRIASPLWVWAWALAATPALAQEAGTETASERSHTYIGVSQAFSHDSNVYRTSTNESKETISVTGVLAGIDQPIGRQRIYGDVAAQINRYQNNDVLNNKSYAINAGLDWQTIEFLSGTLHYSTRNSLADFGELNGSTAASDQITQQFLANVRLGLTSKLSFDTSYEYRDFKYKNDLYADRNYNQHTVGGGFHWGRADQLVFGLGYRATKSRTPEFQDTPPFEDELDRRDIDFTTTWAPTGFSSISARISSTKETHSLDSVGERSGWTGAFSWDYKPTAKLGFVAAIVRDSGAEATFIGMAPDGTKPLRVDQSTLSTTSQLRASYAMTSKISLNGDVHYRKGKLAGGTQETVGAYMLGITYEPLRSVLLGCNVDYENRDTSAATAYTVTVGTCSAQFTLK
jgi:hypothetical protein